MGARGLFVASGNGSVCARRTGSESESSGMFSSVCPGCLFSLDSVGFSDRAALDGYAFISGSVVSVLARVFAADRRKDFSLL